MLVHLNELLSQDTKHIVIIGNGIAGITAARHIRKRSNHRITVISAESDHFFSRTALMYVYMGHMRYKDIKPYEDRFWKKNRIELKRAFVAKVYPESNSIEFDDGRSMRYDDLIIATGSKPNKFGWKGQELKGVQGLYSLQDLELMEERTKNVSNAVVVGGGLIGIEMAEMLRSRAISVTMLVRENSFWDVVLPKEESELINQEIRKHKVDLQLNTELAEIQSDENGNVKAAKTKSGKEIACQFVGLTVGVSPNITFLKDAAVEVETGVLVDAHLRTSFDNIYAIGDCAQLKNPKAGRQSIEAVWYTGKMMGETVAATICGTPTEYDPGIWFNSAKFFNIEYQTYGTVPTELEPHQDTVFWDGKDGKRCLRIVYQKESKAVLGFNAFGIRLRHNVCDAWIRKRTDVSEVLKSLGKANFDPEFFKKFEKEVLQNVNYRPHE